MAGLCFLYRHTAKPAVSHQLHASVLAKHAQCPGCCTRRGSPQPRAGAAPDVRKGAPDAGYVANAQARRQMLVPTCACVQAHTQAEAQAQPAAQNGVGSGEAVTSGGEGDGVASKAPSTRALRASGAMNTMPAAGTSGAADAAPLTPEEEDAERKLLLGMQVG